VVQRRTMFVHIITLRFNAALEAFDQTPLQEFVKDKRLLTIRDHFFTCDEVPYLTLVLTRGGMKNCRSANRNNNTPDNRNNNNGFRLLSTGHTCRKVRFTDRTCVHKALSRPLSRAGPKGRTNNPKSTGVW
jgi:hypothetical protein